MSLTEPEVLETVNLAMAATCALGTLEVVAMGSKMGLSLDCMADVLNKGAARNRTTELLLTAIARGEANSGPRLAQVRRDLERAVQMGMAKGLPMPLLNVACGVVASGANALGERAEATGLVSLVESAAAATLTQSPGGAAPVPAADAAALRVGYVGLGAMGGALARRLMLSRPLQVFDASADAVRAFAADGATGASDLPALARACDVVFICVPTSAVVRQVVFGPGGLAEGLRAGQIVVDQTSGDPVETRAIAAELARRGVSFVDAPVSGGPSGATAGTIAIMCGGPAEAYAAVHPILAAISPNTVYCGAVGNGHVAKLVNNAISAMCRLLTYEAAAAALSHGSSIEALLRALSAGTGWTLSAQRILPGLAEGKAASNFQVGLMLKDVRLAAGLGLSCGAPMALAHAVRTILETGVVKLGAQAKSDDLGGLHEELTGVCFSAA